MFNGKIHYFDWAIFNSYVKLPEGTLTMKNRHFFSWGIQHQLSNQTHRIHGN